MCEKNYPPTPKRTKRTIHSKTTPVHKNTGALHIQNACIIIHTQAKGKGLPKQSPSVPSCYTVKIQNQREDSKHKHRAKRVFYCVPVHHCTAFLLGWLHYTPIHHEKQCTDCTKFTQSFCVVRREKRLANASIAYQRRRHHCDCD